MYRLGDIAICFLPCVLVLGGLGLALGAYAAFRARHRLWRAPGLAAALLAPWLLAATYTGLPIAPNSAILALYPSWQYSTVLRLGVHAVGDAPPLWFVPSSAACSIAGGDVGSEVPTADGGCFNADFAPDGADAREWGARCNGTVDDTAALDAALDWAMADRGTVLLPPANAAGSAVCKITPPLALITAPLTLRGAGPFQTILAAPSGSSGNFIDIGYTDPTASQTQGVTIGNIEFSATNPTGGYAISAHHVANLNVNNIVLNNTFCGIEDEQSNNDSWSNVWGYTVGNKCQAFLWWTNPAAQATGGRSDQLTLNNIHINSQFYGNDGFVWRGMANTLNANNITFLQTNHGFWIDASQNTTGLYPAFASVYDLQVEGAQTAACQIDGGRQFYFTDGFCHSEYGERGPGGNQGDNDVAGLLINPDYTASVTSDLKFENMSIGLSAHQAAIMQAQGVEFANVSFRGSSLASPEADPAVQINGISGQGSADYGFANTRFCGIYGDTTQDSYGLVREANVGSVRIVNGDFNYCQTGEIEDNSAANMTVSNSVDRAGNPLPFSAGSFVGNATPSASCGTAMGNSLVGRVDVRAGSITRCTITFPQSIGAFAGAVLTANTNVGALWVSASSSAGMTINSAASMGHATIFWRVTQGSN